MNNEQTHVLASVTIRDYFAGLALAGIIAHPGMEPDDASKDGSAELAYDFADAMLRQREAK